MDTPHYRRLLRRPVLYEHPLSLVQGLHIFGGASVHSLFGTFALYSAYVAALPE
jgi:hypothetical protein